MRIVVGVGSLSAMDAGDGAAVVDLVSSMRSLDTSLMHSHQSFDPMAFVSRDAREPVAHVLVRHMRLRAT